MIILILLITILIPLSAEAQPEPTIYLYGAVEDRRNWFHDVFVLEDGYIFAGHMSRGNNFSDIWLLKAGEGGDMIWEATFDFENNENSNRGFCVIQSDEGNFLVGGDTHCSIRRDLRFIAMYITDDGELIWERMYREDLQGICHAVIETKSNTFLLAGYIGSGGNRRAYVVHIDREGEMIWDFEYERDDLAIAHTIREHPEEQGYYIAGMPHFALTFLSPDGELQWAQNYQAENSLGSGCKGMVSVEGGYLLVGTASFREDPEQRGRIIRVDREGRLEWDTIVDDEHWTEIYSIARLLNDGAVLTGTIWLDNMIPLIAKVDPAGNIQALWPIQDFFLGFLYGARTNNNDELVFCGTVGVPMIHNSFLGAFVIYEPLVTPPEIIEWSPQELEFSVLPDDTVHFRIVAVDRDGDELFYRWLFDGEIMEDEDTTHTTIPFPDFGLYEVKCVVSDGFFADSIAWLVDVVDFYISEYTPEEESLLIRRNTTVDFSIDVRELDGDPILYDWSIQERPHGAREYLAEDTTAYSHMFPFSAEYAVEALSRRGEQEDSRVWRVFVRSAIQNYYPREEALSIPKGTMRDFWIEPFDPESDSLDYRWTLDGEAIGDTTEVSLLFEEVGQYEVVAYLLDGAELDSQMWVVNVFDPDFAPYDDYALPSEFALHPAYPNPFNNQTHIRFDVPIASEVSVNVFDVRGRLVSSLVDGLWSAGSHSVVWDARDLMSGIYFVKMEVSSSFRQKPESRENVFIQKAVLVK